MVQILELTNQILNEDGSFESSFISGTLKKIYFDTQDSYDMIRIKVFDETGDLIIDFKPSKYSDKIVYPKKKAVETDTDTIYSDYLVFGSLKVEVSGIQEGSSINLLRFYFD